MTALCRREVPWRRVEPRASPRWTAYPSGASLVNEGSEQKKGEKRRTCKQTNDRTTQQTQVLTVVGLPFGEIGSHLVRFVPDGGLAMAA